jgi:glycosyltransferase involved in cell wall biosynthesis
VIVGDGPDRAAVERAARDAGQDVRMAGWLRREDALRWLRHASLVVFPSLGPESLSRVLLEASVLGRPIAAMDTGGTRDIVEHERTGLLSSSAAGLSSDVARLVAHPDLARAFGEAAARRVRDRFDAPRVVERVEAVYTGLLEQAARRGTPDHA